ncbi:MAG: hypothetical protein JWR80_3681 [Bradyrhizobium sp.]|nr:hypothetical protein [Bradyrhizobium sp.]
MSFSRFIRENPIGMLLFAIVGGVVSTYLYETFKSQPNEKSDNSPPPVVSSLGGGSNPFGQCSAGQIVPTTAEIFLLRFVAIEDGEAVRKVMESSPNDYARQISVNVRSGAISRLNLPAVVTVHIHGISGSRIPTEVPLLREDNTCARMVTVSRINDAEARIVIPMGSNQNSSEGSILFPRRIFETSPNARVCAEPTFALAYPTETRQNMYCGLNMSASALRGASSRTFILARAN